MTVPLPPEILYLIATFLKNDATSLVPCTCVCRLWQTNFESLIYSSLVVYSDDEHKEEGQPGISLADFQRLTSGDGVGRQAWIRNLDYNILVPYELLDWTTRKEWRDPEAYCIENPVRKANDLAFQTAMLSLFHTLHSWESNQTPYLKLNLALRGRRRGSTPEPRTEDWDIAGEYCWDYKTGRTFSVPPYRAQFLNDDLPFVPCIEKLSFKNHDPGWGDHHQIWTGVVQTIIQHCPKLVELELNLNEWVRPDHLEYIQLRRAALSSLIGSIPRSLRVL
ncbi:uncharacterized protein N7529_007370 [Penicillium soppii]|uniref:uncharacterized protein n=1 Tax=Penicillium soppii TaxID=69789 RepID=UPI00254920F6|nr:uncharacterized protein N7529_007370 [Penicillium soppii]KAJ5860060.1 hypothetical protein N7529_007370 [Penicillium soppii]